jgi:membrane protein DedA with SNARE-associated domain
MLETLIARWGYLGVGLGTCFEGEATVLAAGALVHKGLLMLPWAWLAAFVGTVLADQLWFFVGRRYGAAFLQKRPGLAARSSQVQRWLERFGAGFVVSLRFLFGLRVASVIWLGSSGFPYTRFVLLDMLGAALWALVMGAVGWGLGATLKAMLGRMGHPEELLLVAVVLLLALLVVRRLRSARVHAERASS